MRYIRRICKHVWPQWHRLVIVVFCALVISVFYSLSFVTLVPMLKVMMGQEGLHGYANRKVCSNRYGLKFYVPDQIDYTNPDVAYYLLVTNVEDDSLAAKAGLKEQDYIVGVGDSLRKNQNQRIASTILLQHLANAPGRTEITIQYQRRRVGPISQLRLTTLSAGPEPFYLAGLQKVMSIVPAQQSSQGKTKAMTLIILLLAVLTLGRCVALFFQKYLAQKVTETAVFEVRKETFAHVLEMPVAFFDNKNPSDAVSRLIGDTVQLSAGLKILFGKTLREPLKAFGLLAFAMLIDLKLTLIFLGGAPLTIIAVLRFGKRIKRFTHKRLIGWSRMLGKLKETFDSVKVVKVYNHQQYEHDQFHGLNRNLLKQLLRIAKVDAATGPIMEVVGMAAGCTALLFGIHWVVKGGLDASEFLAFVVALGAAAESVRKSSDIWNKVQQANAAGERVYAILDRAVEPQVPDAIDLPPLKNKIEFQNVVFTYPNSKIPALKGLSLSVEAGHNIAIVGPNGSGKTTLVNLLPRFYDVNSGAVLIDGIDVRDCTLRSLREQIGMVTQRIITFNDTIAANIAYGKTGATEGKIVAAAKRAYAHEFICELPNGYETVIGETGTGLSGGQLQRIVIARAILKDPTILIFDEATSQVDADSEAKIHAAIEQMMHQRTSFIIAHRFSTVLSADFIVVMDRGQIVAQGRHEELVETSALYQSLYETQLVKA